LGFDCFGREVTVCWQNLPKSDIVGYFFEIKSESGLSIRRDIGRVDRLTLDVSENKQYIFFIIPYDKNKKEGKPSNIIKYKYEPTIEVPNLPTPTIRIK
jgi:hypothetical protein